MATSKKHTSIFSDLDKWDDVLDKHFSNDSSIKKGLANKLNADNPQWIEACKRAREDSALKEFLSQHSKEKWQDPEFRDKLLASRKAVWKDADERRKKVSKQFKGKEKTEAQKKKMSISGKAYWGSEEGRAKKQEMVNRPEVRKAISDTHKGKPKIKKVCRHCNDLVAINVMDRFHNNNCPFKGKKVAAYEGKKLYKKYGSFSEIRNDGFNWETITKVLKGEKESYNNFTFKWVKK